MNKLEKFFNTLHNSQSRVLKKYTTEELVSQIKEYVDFTPFICKNVYRMLISQSSDDRRNGASILKSIMFQFRLVTDFRIEYTSNKDEYFSSTGEEFVAKNISIKEQTRMVKAMADLEHVDCKIVNEIDFKADTSFKIKKQKVKDKPIENIMDFFDNLTANLLNYEWNKRHGAFLAFSAMFSERWEGETEIKVDSSLFMKIYEILKNDKFNDFVEDKTTAPVREAAAELLSCIYPRIPKNTILDELFKFLEEKDWQTQYSGLIALSYMRQFVVKKKELCGVLERLLVDSDEDVKYLSAELLSFFIDHCDIKEVAGKCWDNIRNEEEIAVSKTSIISLLAKIHSLDKGVVHLEENIDLLFPCFTSPVYEVRKSVLEMVREVENESINFLVAETILLDEKEEVRDLALKVLKKNLSKNFMSHFMKIIGGSLYEPYSADDFVSYDELLFTKSGVKLVGDDVILRNRIKLFQAFKEKPDLDLTFSTAIGKTFEEIYKKLGTLRGKVSGSPCKKVKSSESVVDETTFLEGLYRKCSDLRLVPLKELKSKAKNPFKPSLHPMGDPVFRDYLRLKTVLDFPQMDQTIINLFKVETCEEFLRLISDLLVTFYEEGGLDLSQFLYDAYESLVEGNDSLRIFFEAFGCQILQHPFFQDIQKDKKRFDFFSKTILIYRPVFDKLDKLFEESYEQSHVPILKGFIKELKYGELFVGRILEKFDVLLLEGIIGDLDHSFFPLFIKPLLKQMSSDVYNEEASRTFSFIIPRLTFCMSQGISYEWVQRIEACRKSLEALLDISKIPDYTSKCPTSIVLRNYQVEGVKWISFLHSFNLNGILADDMGLGKTIQVLYFVCSEIYKTEKKVLILCPSSLTGHWKAEIDKFFPSISSSLYKKKKGHQGSIVIVSYDMFRNDYQAFIDKDWFYIILDEGHILRNSQTILYSRICQLKPTNRLVLTGTPVHNSVEDLVSIFNFIMPKYLENEKDFTNIGKMSDGEIEKMYSRLENLNKKILPFVLRRLKIDVLTDLPPKIIRDITVEMGPIQQEVYNSVQEKASPIEGDLSYTNKADALKRTRDLLNASSHTSYFKKDSGEVPCKVRALEDIINLCGGDEIRNKILIFFQFKSTIDFVLADIKNKFKLKHLRLDGTVPASKRSKIAQDFNDGSVPLLFLTTQIGGLGLNLTGADTVVFYEHDWNPFNDLQAMDRAHRIGQKKTVNVFRLITKATLEEKVMDLQSFKMFIASSLVSQQNADIETMDTKDLLERFQR